MAGTSGLLTGKRQRLRLDPATSPFVIWRLSLVR